MYRFKFALLCLLVPSLGIAQQYEISNQLPVRDFGGDLYPHAWAGGTTNPRYSNIDLNRDGRQDIIVFDRDGEIFIPYLAKPHNRFQYAPQYMANFDSCNCVNWALTADYNCDGLVDIYCGRGNGENFRVFEQVIYPGDSVGFVKRYDPVGVRSELSGNEFDLYQLATDIPAITDVDYDGDMDVIATTNGFNGFIMNRNLAMERTGRCDTLIYQSEFGCWGGVLENSADNNLAIGDTSNCPRGEGDQSGDGSASRHVGSTLLVFDTNGDSLMELLVGDVSFTSGVMAYNGGTIYEAEMDSVELNYPILDSAIDVSIFPAFYHVDVDQDNVRDLLVAPNIASGTDGWENVNGTVLYRNEGTDNVVDFRFEGRTFLSGQQVDAGSFSSPLFFDHNDDGLQDILLISNFAFYKLPDTTETRYNFHLYENIGTLAQPAYQLVDTNYLNINNVNPPILDPVLAAGDLDGDNDDDLLIGDINGVMHHYINISLNGMPASFVPALGTFLEDEFGQMIDVGNNAAPDLYDMDGDSDLDLIIGQRFGRISYYENVGTPQGFSYRFRTDSLGKIQLTNLFGSAFSGFAKPRIVDWDGDGLPELIAGEETGVLEYYDGMENALLDSIPKVEDLLGADFGWYANPTLAQIDTSDKFTILVGNATGGMMLVRYNDGTPPDDPTSIRPPRPELALTLFPNPTTGILSIEAPASGIQANLPLQIRVFTPLGQQMYRTEGLGPRLDIDLGGLAAGLYLVEVIRGSERAIRKVRLDR
ncbi:MAG: T9SS type A sorting domain-containing protein [Bacteroidota bacterium]